MLFSNDHVLSCQPFLHKLLSIMHIRLYDIVVDLVHYFSIVIGQLHKTLLRILFQEDN